MPELHLFWAGGGKGRGNQKNPSWPDIESKLEAMRGGSGFVRLDILNRPEIGPQNLELRAESGRYILLLGEITDDDHYVRTPESGVSLSELVEKYGFKAKQGLVELQGDLWGPDGVCLDFSDIIQTFRELFETGDVSRELLK